MFAGEQFRASFAMLGSGDGPAASRAPGFNIRHDDCGARGHDSSYAFVVRGGRSKRGCRMGKQRQRARLLARGSCARREAHDRDQGSESGEHGPSIFSKATSSKASLLAARQLAFASNARCRTWSQPRRIRHAFARVDAAMPLRAPIPPCPSTRRCPSDILPADFLQRRQTSISMDEPPQVSIESGGSVCIRPYVLPDAQSGQGHDGPVGGRQQQLIVAARSFHSATITPSSQYPGTTNTLTVSFSTTVALQGGPEGRVRIRILGLANSQTPDTEELAIEPGEGAAAVMGKAAVWRQSSGTLEVPLLAPTEQGTVYAFSFGLLNPAAAAAAGAAYIAVVGGDAVQGRELQVKAPMAHGAGGRGAGGEPGAEGAVEGSVIVETRAELVREWYSTFSGHLRSQYPDDFASGQGCADPTGDVVAVGASSDLVVRCESTGGGLRVSWVRRGDISRRTCASVFIVQVRARAACCSCRRPCCCSLLHLLSALVLPAAAGPDWQALPACSVPGLLLAAPTPTQFTRKC